LFKPPYKIKMATSLEQLRASGTVVVADTGDFEKIAEFKPTDATTNPSLILKAAVMPKYEALVDEAVAYAKANATTAEEQLDLASDKVFVNFGLEILKLIEGRVSTEVDARLSFDVEGSIKKAHKFIELYEAAGIPKERVLIKLSSTWEGIKAAEVLEKEGIHCNLTLLFSLCQAIACAEVNVRLISPFVGRILDWHKKQPGFNADDTDPGVASVRAIFNYYKKHGYDTQVMGASFRNVSEITELAGCDLLTIGPNWLADLKNSTAPVPKKLDAALAAKECNIEKLHLDEKQFRYMLNDDALATEKLAEGIRGFCKDQVKLETLLKDKLAK